MIGPADLSLIHFMLLTYIILFIGSVFNHKKLLLIQLYNYVWQMIILHLLIAMHFLSTAIKKREIK